MTYDFSTIIPRSGMDAIAVDGVGGGGFAPDAPKEGFDVIPMWVADMNFATCPGIQNSLLERIQHPCYGYFSPQEEYFDSIIRWHRDRNGVEGMRPEHIGYENGVLGCVVSAVNAFTTPGDGILLHSPTYIGFTNSLKNCGRRIIHSPLVQDENGVWRMDYADMDAKLKQYKIHFAVFCSPHNPCGRVWTREEIEQAMEVYRKNDVIVVSDEIWSDIILDENRHIPTQSVSEDAKNRTIAVYAPSKTFNLAGLVGSYHVIYNQYLRDRVERQSQSTHYNEMNVLSMHALMGGYSLEGHLWVDELCEVLSGNLHYAADTINQKFEGVTTKMPQGTYMLLLDCEGWCRAHSKTMDDLLKAGWDVGVAWQDGRPFHAPYGIRMNLALPRSRVEEAMRRLETYVFHH